MKQIKVADFFLFVKLHAEMEKIGAGRNSKIYNN